MRDPERINKILNLIDYIWNKSPDLILCQLISNIIKTGKEMSTKDIFYIEDDFIEKELLNHKKYKIDGLCWVCDNPGDYYGPDALGLYTCKKCFDLMNQYHE